MQIYASIVANPSFALVPKGVYDTPIFEELLQRCEPLDHFHFLFGAKTYSHGIYLFNLI